MAVIHDVLELARWAPSGDNTQPWRFEILSDTSALVHCYDTREHCVYDLDGHASQIAHGALLETIAVAAPKFRMRAIDRVVEEHSSGNVIHHVALQAAPDGAQDPLARYIIDRSVERRSMKLAPLASDQRDRLAASIPGYVLRFEATLSRRAHMALLNASNAYIRLTIPEAFAVHKNVIEWHAKTSEDRLPDASLGAGPALLATMRFAMASFERIDFMNRFAGGTLLPRLALDITPGIRCAAHFVVIAKQEPRTMSDRVRAGRAIQRLWLTATQLGLRMQPSYTPLVFARYAREGRRFTESQRAQRAAHDIARKLQMLVGADQAAKVVFMGRVGIARAPDVGRSLRLPLSRLIVTRNSPS